MCPQHLPPGLGYGDYTSEWGISAPWPENGLSFGLGVALRVREHESISGGLGEVFWPGVSGCNFWVDPKNDLIVVFLTHAPLHRTTHRVDLRDAIYGGVQDECIQPRAPPYKLRARRIKSKEIKIKHKFHKRIGEKSNA